MKPVKLLNLLLGVTFLPLTACGQLPEQKASITVVDQDGKPVAGASVGMGFDVGPGKTGFGTETTTKRTDTQTDGRVAISGGSTTGYIGVGARKEGYYEAHTTFQAKSAKTGRWEPWNPEIKLVLKQKRNPVAMYGFTVGRDFNPNALPIPLVCLQTPLGFDLLKHDWVAPHGKGVVADVVISFEEGGFDGIKKTKFEFQGGKNGIQVWRGEDGGSAFKGPHEAPVEGYASTMEFPNRYQMRDEGRIEEIAKMPRFFMFRIRTVLDSKGTIVSALYGKLDRSPNAMRVKERFFFDQLSYSVNPDPRSRNLECDPTKNLFTDLDKGNWPTEP